MLCGVAQAVVLKKIMGDYKALPIVFWSFVIGAIPFLIPIFLFEKNFLSYPFFDLQILAGILYATLLSSVVGYYFLYYGIKYIKASEIGIFSYVDPIATILIAIPLLSEKITPLYLIGTFLVFFGIFIAEERINYHPLGKLFENANSKDLYNLNQI
jgi:drug/metabolite transporter (DMT)-like permease